ncbi:hypothetical protein RHIZ_22055 [Rhizobium skierniewicense]|uniref:hypothetical protein n=1 Tax=Rhizobium skierniewicense TaxID=984260 RepID=UPI001FADBAB6|nr:hypothetical protein [Rhizobium skierniewicense]MCI9868646.1 hypothetical protein [Rhizobium skierniewicense]
MTLPASTITQQKRLKTILQDEIGEDVFERLVAALIGKLLGVGIALAKRGFQFGGDAGPSGRQERRFRIETKRYADSTSLSQRELLGEVDHALMRDEALEGWFLAATRHVPEQLEADLLLHGERLGVPIVVIDCKTEEEIWSLTALCTHSPEIVEALATPEAGDIARNLKARAEMKLQQLYKDFESWQLGYENLRTLSHAQVSRIWQTPATAMAKLGQDAAGGSRPHRIRRQEVIDNLDQWWTSGSTGGAPAALVGLDGVGKTWAGLNWLAENLNRQPLVLTIPSSFIGNTRMTSGTGVRRLLAELLFELTEIRSVDHWILRLNRLLLRPSGEGPLMTIFIDGLNQVSETAWIELIRTLQDDPFAGRIRLIVTTRIYHFEEKLRSLRGLAIRPIRIDVADYNTAELEAMLAFEKLDLSDLHPELIPLAKRPRLFALVVDFRTRLIEANSITPHRLLWEYGKDTLALHRSFSEREWREWLQELAQRTLSKVRTFSSKSLSETTARPDLTQREVFDRLSDLIDGQFVNATGGGYEPTPAIVAHALGLAVLIHLEELEPGVSIEVELDKWLDSIAGLDERAEVLRAAISIIVARDEPAHDCTATILLAWLQSQNFPEAHNADLHGLARALSEPLLDSIATMSHVHRSSRLRAVNAIRSLPRDDRDLAHLVIRKCADWLRAIPRDVEKRSSPEAEKSRATRLETRIGRDSPGPLRVIGQTVELVDQHVSASHEAIPSLLEGFPLAYAIPVFEGAALAYAIRHREEIWESLKWLVLLNSNDRPETTAAIRARALEISTISPEAGIHPEVPKRVAALMGWLNSTDEDNEVAAAFLTPIYSGWNYEEHYLSDPGKSFFALERRHAGEVLENPELSLFARLNRAKQLWLDPSFDPPLSVVDEIIASVDGFPVDELDSHISLGPVDIRFQHDELFLARVAPETLASLVGRKLQGLGARDSESRYWVGARIREHAILWDASAVEPARKLRTSSTHSSEAEENFVSSNLMMIEVLDLPADEQMAMILQAGIGDNLDLEEVVTEPSAGVADSLLAELNSADPHEAQDLAVLMLLARAPLTDRPWDWLLDRAFAGDTDPERSVAFQALWQCDAKRFGQALMARDWSWKPGGTQFVNHFGSLAIAAAAESLPFDQLAPRLAPWLLLTIARERGQGPNETVFAAQLIDRALRPDVAVPELGSQIIIDLERREDHPFAISLVPLTVDDELDPKLAFRAAMDFEGRRKAQQQAVEIALQRIDEARKEGADLFLASFKSDDFRALFHHVPDLIDAWIEGVTTVTSEFRRRVLLAESFYFALCEAALHERPELGSALWRALKQIGCSGQIGRSKISELIHIPFRVRQTSQSDELLDELLDIESAKTDKDLFDIALAAAVNAREDWLTKVIEEDTRSGDTWRLWRAELLSGFRSGNSLPVDDAWPLGELGSAAHRRYQSGKWRLAEACARFWWRKYLAAQDTAHANAAWVLFAHCADRRSLQWIRTELPKWRTGDKLQRLKRIHAVFNYQSLMREIEKHEAPLSGAFLRRKTVRGINPWL